jgi:hypothetical protein
MKPFLFLYKIRCEEINMAWKFKRWKIKYDNKKNKFNKIKRDREKSRQAHIRWRKNKGKMKAALRKSKIKRKQTMKKNKARGIYKKLKMARKRWKNIIKSDRNLENFFDGMLMTEEQIFEKYEPPELEMDPQDIHQLKIELKKVRDDIELEDREDKKIFNDWMDSAIELLDYLQYEDDEISRDHEDFIEEVIAFIEQYAEEVGMIDEEEDD